MAEKLNGTLVRLEVESVTPGTWLLVSEETSQTERLNVDKIDVTSKDNGGWREEIPGLKSGENTFEVLVDRATSAGKINYSALRAMLLSREIKNWRIRIDATQDIGVTFKGFLTSCETTAEMETAYRASLGLSITTQPVEGNLTA
ncbi:hypothetical protein F5984_13220 [Rudanella paleaurantiibacter]|uniref:Phage tail protein n=1 Tax=Rudanella paleaurantiibacter TaxID=2614655 RepID=A0A7J5TYC0_9BACT|nr:phage tail tube protein [Rudanella paleaurantiibacter]KAB7730138.1 hypothetical protein F5984_13220 [Rudanella paleaurantiibacter]